MSGIGRLIVIGRSLRRRDHDVAVVDLLVIALQHYWSRLAFVAVERASGNARNLSVVDDQLVVEHHCDPASDQGDVEALPLTSLLCGIAGRGDESVNAANSVAFGLLSEVVFDLDLVAP